MTIFQQPGAANIDTVSVPGIDNDRLMETLHILSEGSAAARAMLNNLVAQYSWDAYLNELEFE